jgi:hypothetical protein
MFSFYQYQLLFDRSRRNLSQSGTSPMPSPEKS